MARNLGVERSARLKDMESGSVEVKVCEDSQEVMREGAVLFAELSRQAILDRGRFTVLLSGGNTPRGMHDHLSKMNLDWSRIQFFWGDERAVPPTDPDSNYRMAKETLFDRIEVPKENIHRIHAEFSDPGEAARQYEWEIRKVLKDDLLNGFPRFDLAIQGLGEDGHTASLFPGSETDPNTQAWVIAPFVQKFGKFRISVTLGVLNSARFVLFLATSTKKAEMVGRMLEPQPEHQALLPAQRVKPFSGRTLWLLDRAAAGQD